MKKILIDARLYGPKHTGIGRYVKNLLKELVGQADFKKYEFSLLVYQDQVNEVKNDLGNHFKIIPTTITHYSISEQLMLPGLINKLHPDLVHFTNFNKPIFYFGKSVVTIHDLIKHVSRGKDTTTRNPALYWFKYLGYLVLSELVIKGSQIVVPSNYWRDYLIRNFKLSDDKVVTTYLAVDSKFAADKKIDKPSDYILYTGNVYPHKNVDVVLKAMKYVDGLKLKVICARSVFTSRLEIKIKELGLENRVEILGFVPDEEFRNIYKKAIALVHPSKLEGFSLTGLEAMALNCPVVAAKASCLPEVYGESVLYFDPDNEKELSEILIKLRGSEKLREELIEKGWEQIKKYSWKKTAEKTMAIYSKLI